RPRKSLRSRLPSINYTNMELMDGNLDLSDFRGRERQVLARATSLRPADRFPSCMEMVTALEEAHYHMLARAEENSSMLPPPSSRKQQSEPKPPEPTPLPEPELQATGTVVAEPVGLESKHDRAGDATDPEIQLGRGDTIRAPAEDPIPTPYRPKQVAKARNDEPVQVQPRSGEPDDWVVNIDPLKAESPTKTWTPPRAKKRRKRFPVGLDRK